MVGRQLAALVLSDGERAELMSLAAQRNTGQAPALRARIVLRCATGRQNKQVAANLSIDQTTVGKWRRRFAEHRMEGLQDEPRSGTPRTIEDARIEAVIVRTLESVPPDATHWSSRGMARACGFRFRRCRGFGAPSACNRTGWRPSSSPPTTILLPRCAMWSAFMLGRRLMPSCFVWMRSRKSRPRTAASPCCRCVSASRRGAAMTTSAMALPCCSPPSTSLPAK